MNLYNSNNYLRKGSLVEAKAMRLPKGVIDPDFIQKKEKLFRIPTDRKSSSFVQKNEKTFLKNKAYLQSKAYLHLTKVGKLY